MMKLLLLTLLIISGVCVPHLSRAQVSIGARGGAVYSRPTTLTNAPSRFVPSETVNGASAALVLEVSLADRVTLLVEPGFVRKGMNIGWERDYYVVDGVAYWVGGHPFVDRWNTTVDYIELPICLKMSFLDGPIHPYLTAGSGIAYKLKESYTVTGVSYSQERYPDAGFYARYDVTLQTGAGISYCALDPVSVLVDGRYSFGLNNVDRIGWLGMKSAEWRISGGIMVGL